MSVASNAICAICIAFVIWQCVSLNGRQTLNDMMPGYITQREVAMRIASILTAMAVMFAATVIFY